MYALSFVQLYLEASIASHLKYPVSALAPAYKHVFCVGLYCNVVLARPQ